MESGNKYDVYIGSDGWCEGCIWIEVYNDITKQLITNKEEWKQAMRQDNILDSLWQIWVEDINKDGE